DAGAALLLVAVFPDTASSVRLVPTPQAASERAYMYAREYLVATTRFRLRWLSEVGRFDCGNCLFPFAEVGSIAVGVDAAVAR
ncbi:MAG: hypothetical protein WD397_16685, partial [Wenzhouxiangellaceae bacterium]